ncbi:MAG: hypothetical protein JF588_11580 [Caulobacterales bacterium]|nr:hypothetical protein [Caulobacterales bacterium]
MARHKMTYPGLADPRAALEPMRAQYDYLVDLKRRFHISTPAYRLLETVTEAMRAAACELTQDRYFLGLPPPGQSVYQPPQAQPVPGEPPRR